ncbi:hypothetical protein D3C76_1637430 [compost metagenome]
MATDHDGLVAGVEGVHVAFDKFAGSFEGIVETSMGVAFAAFVGKVRDLLCIQVAQDIPAACGTSY